MSWQNAVKPVIPKLVIRKSSRCGETERSAYSGRSEGLSVIADNPRRKARLSLQKSAEAIVPGGREGLNTTQRQSLEAFDVISITAENLVAL